MRSAAAATAVLLALMLGACGSGSSSSTTSTTTNAAGPPAGGGTGGSHAGAGAGPGAPPASRTSHPRRHHHHGPPGSPMHRTYPGRILSHDMAAGGPVQPAELWPVTNGWQISDHRRLTAVFAGSNPQRRSTGRLVIFRQNFVHVTQTSDRVDVPGAGPLTITRAPHGKAAQTAAQREGTLEFRGADGRTGTLHLRHDTVTLGSS